MPYYADIIQLIKLNTPSEFLNALSHLVLNTKTDLFYWVEVLDSIDDLLGITIQSYKQQDSAKLQHKQHLLIMLKFTDSLLQHASSRSIYNSVEHLLEILMLDDWELVMISLDILIALTSKAFSSNKLTKAHKNPKLTELLINIAFGYNVNCSKKYTFLEVITEESLSSPVFYFEYMMQDQHKLREKATVQKLLIDLRNFQGTSSTEITEQIIKTHSIPDNLRTPLLCRVRLAYTVTNLEKRKLSIICAMKAYSAFIYCSDNYEYSSKFIESQPIMKLIPSAIEILKTNISLDFNCYALELLTGIANTVFNHTIDIDMLPAILNQVGFITQNGYFQVLLRDVTNLQYKLKEGKCMIVCHPEKVPPKIASDSKFLHAVLSFISSFDKIQMKGNIAICKTVIVTSLFNLLQSPIEGVYLYNINNICKAIGILISIMKNSFEDISSIDVIIQSLCTELSLLITNQPVIYATYDSEQIVSTDAKSEDRKELIKMLFRLLLNSVIINTQHTNQNLYQNNPPNINFDAEGNVSQQNQPNRTNNQNNQNAAEAIPLSDQQQQTVASSRKVLESKLFERSAEMFNFMLNKAEYNDDMGPICSQCMQLISTVMGDIPTCIPMLIEGSLISTMLKILKLPNQSPNNEYVVSCYRFVHSLLLHAKGDEILYENKESLKNIFKCYSNPYFCNSISSNISELLSEHMRLILPMHAQATKVKKVIIKSFFNVYQSIKMQGEQLVKTLDIDITNNEDERTNFFNVAKVGLKLLVEFFNNFHSNEDKHLIESLQKLDQFSVYLVDIMQLVVIVCTNSPNLSKQMRKLLNLICMIFRSFRISDPNNVITNSFFDIISSAHAQFDSTKGTMIMSITSHLLEKKIGLNEKTKGMIYFTLAEAFCEYARYICQTDNDSIFNGLVDFHIGISKYVCKYFVECIMGSKDKINAQLAKLQGKAFTKHLLTAMSDEKFDIVETLGVTIAQPYYLQIGRTYCSIIRTVVQRSRISPFSKKKIVSMDAINAKIIDKLITYIISILKNKSPAMDTIVLALMELESLRTLIRSPDILTPQLIISLYDSHALSNLLEVALQQLINLTELQFPANLIQKLCICEIMQIVCYTIEPDDKLIYAQLLKRAEPSILVRYSQVHLEEMSIILKSILSTMQYPNGMHGINYLAIYHDATLQVFLSMLYKHLSSKSLINVIKDVLKSSQEKILFDADKLLSPHHNVLLLQLIESFYTLSHNTPHAYSVMLSIVNKLPNKLLRFANSVTLELSNVIKDIINGYTPNSKLISAIGDQYQPLITYPITEQFKKVNKCMKECSFYKNVAIGMVKINSIMKSFIAIIKKDTSIKFLINLVDANFENDLLQLYKFLTTMPLECLNATILQQILIMMLVLSQARAVKKSQIYNEIPSRDELVTLLTGTIGKLHDNKIPVKLLNNDVITSVMHLLVMATTHHPAAEIFIEQSGFICLLGLRKSETLTTYPFQVMKSLVINAIESTPVLLKYMERIIKGTLFAIAKSNDQVDNKKSKRKRTYQESVEEIASKSFVKINDFIGNFTFLAKREPRIFNECVSKLCIVKETINNDKILVKYIGLTKNAITEMMIYSPILDIKEVFDQGLQTQSKSVNKAQSQKKQESEDTKKYKAYLHSSIRQCSSLVTKPIGAVIDSMIDALIEIRETDYTPIDKLLNESVKKNDKQGNHLMTISDVLKMLTDVIRIYPETLTQLIKFQSNARSNIAGDNIIKYFVRSIFPIGFVRVKEKSSTELEVFLDSDWSSCINQFVRALIFENTLLFAKDTFGIRAEIRRRIVTEILLQLKEQVSDKKNGLNTVKSEAITMSCLSLVDSMIYCKQLSALQYHPINYTLIHLFTMNKDYNLFDMLYTILRTLNFHSSQGSHIISLVVALLEKLTRYKKSRKHSDSQKSKSVTEDEENFSVDPLLREAAHIEENIVGDEENESMDNSDDIIENSDYLNGDSENNRSLDEMESDALSHNSENIYMMQDYHSISSENESQIQIQIHDNSEGEIESLSNQSADDINFDNESRQNEENSSSSEDQPDVAIERGNIYNLDNSEVEESSVSGGSESQEGSSINGVDTIASRELLQRFLSMQDPSPAQPQELNVSNLLAMMRNARDRRGNSSQQQEYFGLSLGINSNEIQNKRPNGHADKSTTSDIDGLYYKQDLSSVKGLLKSIFQTDKTEKQKKTRIYSMDLESINLLPSFPLLGERYDDCEISITENLLNESHPLERSQIEKDILSSIEVIKVDYSKKEEEKKIQITQLGKEDKVVLPSIDQAQLTQKEDKSLTLQLEDLRKAGIDPSFLDALPPDIRREVLAQAIATSQANMTDTEKQAFIQSLPPEYKREIEEMERRANPITAEQVADNATFIASLSPELREEILLTSDRAFLNSLPQDMQHEANSLHLRYFGGLDFRNKHPKDKKKDLKAFSYESFAKYIEKIIPDGDTYEVTSKLVESIQEKAIEAVMRLLYIDTKTRIYPLIANMCQYKKLCKVIIPSLAFILCHHCDYEGSAIKQGAEEFPPRSLYHSIDRKHLTYVVISVRILRLLIFLLKCCTKEVVGLMMKEPKSAQLANRMKGVNPSYSYLNSITKLKLQLNAEGVAIKESETLAKSIIMLQHNMTYQNSYMHLSTFLSFLNILIVQSEEINVLQHVDDTLVELLFKIQFLENNNDKSLNTLWHIISTVCKNEQNFEYLLSSSQKCLKESIQAINTSWAEGVPSEHCHEIRIPRIIKMYWILYKENEKVDESIGKDQKANRVVFEDEANEDLSEKKKLSMDEINLSIQDKLEHAFLSDDLLELFESLSRSITSTQQLYNIMKFVPFIETLFIAYQHCFKPSKIKSMINTYKAIIKKGDTNCSLSNKIFCKFVITHKSIINKLIRQMQVQFMTLLQPIIEHIPWILEFDNKKNYFRSEIKKLKSQKYAKTLHLTVRRTDTLMDSIRQLGTRKPEEWKGKLDITFANEDAVDAGGVTREWFSMLSKDMFNPGYALFKMSPHGNTYLPNAESIIVPEHLTMFKFIGHIIGKALLDGFMLDCFFTKGMYKMMVEQPLNQSDMDDLDPSYYKNLKWVLENNCEGLGLTFSYESDYFGKTEIKELEPNGISKYVTEQNKHEYVLKMCKAKLYDEIKPQVTAVLEGLHDILPRTLICIFDYRELELMISGLPDIDVADMKCNTEYIGYTKNSDVIKWFWEIIESFSQSERAEFLQFVTGTSRVPLGGFKNLQGSSGSQKFQIQKYYGSIDYLPKAHTWYALY